MPKYIFFILTISLLALAGCTADKGADPLDGSAWELVSMGDQLTLEGTTLTLSFAEGQAGGNAGCNSYSGTYQVDGDAFTLDEVVSTLMACVDTAVMDQEQAYLAALNEVSSYSLTDGTLVLYRADGSALKFIPQP